MAIYQSDLLIIGSGIAGLTTAIKYAQEKPNHKVIVLTKADANESNTKYAQGGIAVVTNATDSFEKHVQDTLIAGDGLCNEEVVRVVVSEGPDRLKEIIEWGTNFDKDEHGNYDLGLEGGHTENRVLHHKDITGFEIERSLLKKVKNLKNITLYPHFFVIDLITEHQIYHQHLTVDSPKKCYGAYALDSSTGKIETFVSGNTILATGGAGQVYAYTTNPTIATGDGVAVAYRAKAKVDNMQFVQFHPTALYDPSESPSFLITEAIRGFGAYLRNKNGERFMFKYDERGEMASRDIVSQSIDKELKISGDDCVYLDCNHLDKNKFIHHFPNIFEKCLTKGIIITKDWIPIVPAAHYFCGGIAVDLFGRTNIENLYANGECASTGLHGANRLASNSLLEALVYANQIFEFLKNNDKKGSFVKTIISDRFISNNKSLDKKIIHKFKEDLQNSMQRNVGIVRNDTDLKKTLEQLLLWKKQCLEMEYEYKLTKDFLELKNMITVSIPIVAFSLKRNENKGSFFKEGKTINLQF